MSDQVLEIAGPLLIGVASLGWLLVEGLRLERADRRRLEQEQDA